MIHDHKFCRTVPAEADPAAARICRMMPMVRQVAWHVHCAGRPEIEFKDLVQAGLVALTEAAQRHAGPGEGGFAAYARIRVRGAMIDLARRMVPLSRSKAAGRPPLRFESIDQGYSDCEPGFADNRPDSFAELAASELNGRVAGAIAALPERLGQVIRLHFLEERSLAEIAAELQISVPRVHQLKARALVRLRKALAELDESA
jgi:RNA polymerase sigma factor for flagellar operon FliA